MMNDDQRKLWEQMVAQAHTHAQQEAAAYAAMRRQQEDILRAQRMHQQQAEPSVVFDLKKRNESNSARIKAKYLTGEIVDAEFEVMEEK